MVTQVVGSRGKYRFALLLFLAFFMQMAAAAAFFIVITLDADDRESTLLAGMVAQHAMPLAALALMALLALALGLNALRKAYVAPVARLAEDAVLVAANPGHRAVPQGAPEVRELIGKFNALASAYQALHEEVQSKVESAGHALAEEKNRLAALMSELALSVLVCNIEGRILLYNARARELFGSGPDDGYAALGLGRSLFAAIERGLIVHALEQIQYQLRQDGSARPVAGFVATLAGGRMVRAQMAPVLDNARTLVGFVLTLDDITRTIEAGSARDALLQSLTQGTRAAVANIRAAVEAMQAFPDMSPGKREQFTAIINDESMRLARQLDGALRQHADRIETQWQLEDMRGSDLISLLTRKTGMPSMRIIASDTIDASLWLKVDSYALAETIAQLMRRLRDGHGVTELRIGLQSAGRLAHLDLDWPGAPLDTDTLHDLEHAPAPSSLAEVMERHGGTTVYRYDTERGRSRFCLLLPVAPPQVPIPIRPLQSERPEFYDFDLFHQAGQNPELDRSPLSRLSYTVFDTETTGLQPSAGDEIISIGALRIVNGRLLHQESFDQLVKPRRLLSEESIRIHGITDSMLRDQPHIEKVLPQFHRFCQDTVLVAHNAAFDMRFLQMQQQGAGVAFDQPVLDTLLLSQVVHPRQESHTLEAIAARLGVAIIGRHSALGDAIVTAEVFLKMIPLLAEKGLRTLGDAREEARRTLYARLRY